MENEVDTDSLFVYDGENATSKELGVFYGGRPPPKEGLYSTSYKMFVIFKSDNTSALSGFSAIYCEGTCSGKSLCDRSYRQTSFNISLHEMP